MSALTLASTSVSRQAVLRAAGIDFQVAAPGVDEDRLKNGLLSEGATPRDVALALAEEKALAVSRRVTGPVVGADQTLDLAGKLFDKPKDMGEARQTLMRLRGRTHFLHSAVVVAQGGVVKWSTVVSPRLVVRVFSDAFIDDYLALEGERVLSSVGAYLIEGVGIQLFDDIEGDHFAVLGLPLLPLLAFLRTVAAGSIVAS